MQHLIYASILYAIFQLTASLAAPRISELWFLIISGISVPIFTFIIVAYKIHQGSPLGHTSTTGIVFLTLSSFAIALYNLFLSRSFQSISAEIAIPTIFGIAILLSTITTYIINKQLPSTTQLISLLLISGGLVLLGSHPK